MISQVTVGVLYEVMMFFSGQIFRIDVDGDVGQFWDGVQHGMAGSLRDGVGLGQGQHAIGGHLGRPLLIVRP